MDIDKFSNGTIKNKTLEEWLYEKDDFDLQSFLEEDTEDAVIEEQKKNEPEQETKFDYCSHWGGYSDTVYSSVDCFDWIGHVSGKAPNCF